jgi:tRNA threonylcarbamoyladenosine biosynthesis protein TsaE
MPASVARTALVTTADVAETQELGARLAAVARAGDVLLLRGDLGAGKTQLAKGFGRGLGVTATINSPSFVLMAEYAGRLPLFHIDLFRLDGPADVVAGGLHDERRDEGVTLIEWPERLGETLVGSCLIVDIEGTGDDPRTIRLTARGPSHERYVDAVSGPRP